MQIIRKITHHKNSLNRKLHSIFEAGNLRKMVIVKDFGCAQKQNIKICKRYAQVTNTTQIIIQTSIYKMKLKNSTKEIKMPP